MEQSLVEGREDGQHQVLDVRCQNYEKNRARTGTGESRGGVGVREGTVRR